MYGGGVLSLRSMRTTINHLPLNRRRQVQEIVDIILQVIVPDKIILFGSYARGNYVEHRYTGQDGIMYEYISDYDFLVITAQPVENAYEYEEAVISRTQHLKQPVSMLLHDIEFINRGLEEGWYFFREVISEGVLLYDTQQTELAAPRLLQAEEIAAQRRNYFERWHQWGREFLADARQAFERGSYPKAAYYLHQAAESFYYTMLLMHTGYKPKTHNLYKLRRQTKHLSEPLFNLFPVEQSHIAYHLFDLLKRGYIDARYKEEQYLVSKEELAALIGKVEAMRQIVAESGEALLVEK